MGREGAAPQLEIEASGGPGGPVLDVRGELDAFTCRQFEDALFAAVDEAGSAAVTVRAGRLDLIDSVNLGVIVRAHRRLSERGGRLVIESPTPLVRQVLELAELDRVVEVR
jgi:anti-sigma B factor antagonist